MPGTGRRTGTFPTPVAALVVLVARVAGVLDLEWTRDAEILRARLDQPVDAAGDVVLTADEETAYQRVVTRFNRMWTLADPGGAVHLLTATGRSVTRALRASLIPSPVRTSRRVRAAVRVHPPGAQRHRRHAQPLEGRATARVVPVSASCLRRESR